MLCLKAVLNGYLFWRITIWRWIVSVWQKNKWQDVLHAARQWQFAVHWAAAHQKDKQHASQWNNLVDDMARIATIDVVKDWNRLLEWLHVKWHHSGSKDLYMEAQARGWPVTRKQCETCISECGLCHTRLDHNLLTIPPLHLWQGKGLWDTWQVDYIGPFRKSEGKQYVLVGVEIISGLTLAMSFARATGENAILPYGRGLELFQCLRWYNQIMEHTLQLRLWRNGLREKAFLGLIMYHIIPNQMRLWNEQMDY